MARVVVVNPPHRKRRRHPKRVRRNHKRRFSAKARAAAMRNLRKARMKLNPHKRHRRRVRRAAKRRRHKRSRSFINPFAGTLAVMGNPTRTGHRKHRRHHMARRRHRRHSRRSLRNPFSAGNLMATPKELISTQNIMEAAGVAAGFVLPNMVMNYVPATWRSTTLTYYATKVGTVVVLSAAGAMVSKRVAKFVLVGGTVSLLLDLYTEWMSGKSPAPATPPAPGTAPATSAFYGNLSAYYGGMSDWDIP